MLDGVLSSVPTVPTATDRRLDAITQEVRGALARIDSGRRDIVVKIARVQRDIETTQRLLNEARDLCRDSRPPRSFDKWCKSGKFGIQKTQIYNYLNGRTSVHPERLMNFLLGKTVNKGEKPGKHFWLTQPVARCAHSGVGCHL
jgi:hypothetical protein